MTKIWERLFVGNLRDANALAASDSHGIATVITVSPEEVQQKNAAVNYLRFPIADSRPITAEKFDAIMNAVAENIRWGKVLIHCIGGSSRSPILAAAWMHLVGYKQVEDALAEIARRRPIEPSPTLLKSVMEHL